MHIAATPKIAWIPVVAVMIASIIALTIVALRDRSRLLRATQLRDLMPMAQPLPCGNRFPNMVTQNLPGPSVVGFPPMMPHVGHAPAAQSLIRVT